MSAITNMKMVETTVPNNLPTGSTPEALYSCSKARIEIKAAGNAEKEGAEKMAYASEFYIELVFPSGGKL